jgi:hypothetical protein
MSEVSRTSSQESEFLKQGGLQRLRFVRQTPKFAGIRADWRRSSVLAPSGKSLQNNAARKNFGNAPAADLDCGPNRIFWVTSAPATAAVITVPVWIIKFDFTRTYMKARRSIGTANFPRASKFIVLPGLVVRRGQLIIPVFRRKLGPFNFKIEMRGGEGWGWRGFRNRLGRSSSTTPDWPVIRL